MGERMSPQSSWDEGQMMLLKAQHWSRSCGSRSMALAGEGWYCCASADVEWCGCRVWVPPGSRRLGFEARQPRLRSSSRRNRRTPHCDNLAACPWLCGSNHEQLHGQTRVSDASSCSPPQQASQASQGQAVVVACALVQTGSGKVVARTAPGRTAQSSRVCASQQIR